MRVVQVLRARDRIVVVSVRRPIHLSPFCPFIEGVATATLIDFDRKKVTSRKKIYAANFAPSVPRVP